MYRNVICIVLQIYFFIMESNFKSTSVFKLGNSELIAYALISFIVVLWCNFKWNRRHFDRLAIKMPGPPAYPIVGNGLHFVGTPQRKKKNAQYF